MGDDRPLPMATAGQFDLSHMAMNRIAEDAMAHDPNYRRDIERRKRPLLSDGRRMSDDEVLHKLNALGVPIQRDRLSDLAQRHVSAEALAKAVVPDLPDDWGAFDSDWLWICLTVLWERWLADHPNTEMLDDRMQEGYRSFMAGDEAGAAEIWLDVWTGLRAIAQRADVRRLADLDAVFRGTQFIVNWVYDLEQVLLNGGLKEKRVNEQGLALCEQLLELDPEPHLVETFRRSLAEFHLRLGDRAKHDDLFRRWLEFDPRWGWGWIGWSDSYYLFAWGEKDFRRAVELLDHGLAVRGVRDRDEILRRRADIHREAGVSDGSFKEDPRGTAGEGGAPRMGASDKPIRRKKVGANAPCPCGSGRKYKMCCQP